jgi:hypothetical protein
VPGTFTNIDTVGYSRTINITNTNLRPSFSEGQVLRLYGASAGNTAFTVTTGLTVAKFGLAYTPVGNVPALNTTISYRVADFNIENGEISAASDIKSVQVSVASVGSTEKSLGEYFNSTNFIRLTLSGTSARRGVAVYRQIGNGSYKLIAVLGTKEVQAGSWIDYYNFDYTDWSGKSSVDNSYTQIVHFPLTPPSTQRRGWVDRSIQSITSLSNSFSITLNESAYVAGTSQVSVFHNDTGIINNAIIANSIVGKKSIVLNAKTYNSSQIKVPNNFGITGTAYITQIRKLPWTGGETGIENGKFITANQGTNATGISLVGIDINGNIVNQFLFPDGTVPNTNYLVDFGAQSNSVLIDKVRITNSPAGGIWATSPTSLKITTSEVVNSCLTDRYSYSPLIADDGDTTMVVANKFENYSKLVDVSVTDKGVFANNIVSNCGDEFGYGVFVYGSTFFLSSPNVLIGPAGEFLPTPDTLNSEYDLINVDLSQARTTGEYISPVHVYQENGASYDLTQTDGSASSIEYRAFYLQRTAQGVEEVYGTTYTPANFTPGKRYTILSLGTTTQTQWNTAAGGIAGRQYVVGSSFICAAAVPSGGTGTATSGGVDAITLNPSVGDLNRALGQFGFSIPAEIVSEIKTAEGVYSSSTLRSVNPLHQGIGWTASYRHDVKAATIPAIIDNGKWTVDPAGISPIYTVTVTEMKYLGVGKWVKVVRDGWANPKGVLEGRITQISTAGNQSLVTIQFPGAGGGTDQSLAATAGLADGSNVGQLNITDTFVMAQGRII